MYYLKCNNCGHHNEMKSEFQVFCTSCNKKLDNYFSDWQKRNPEKSFDDYKNMVCSTISMEMPVIKRKSKTPKIILIVAAALVFITMMFFIGKFVRENVVGLITKFTTDKALNQIANELNKSCPLMVDNETCLDNVTVLSDNTLQYNYTLINMLKDSIDVNKIKTYLEPNIISNVKTNPEMEYIRKAKVTLNYSYKDKTGTPVLTIIVTPEMYQE